MPPRLTLARAAVSFPHSDLSELDFDTLEVDWFEWLGLSDLGRTRKAAQLKRLKREIILTIPARWISMQLNPEVRDERLEQIHHWQEQLDIKRIHATLSPATQTTDLPNVKSITAYEPCRGAGKMSGTGARVIDPFHEFGA